MRGKMCKKWFGFLLCLGMIVWNGCDNDLRMCETDSACYTICGTYEQSVMMYACTEEGTCVCIDSEELACDASETVEEGELSHCEKVCSAVRPGTIGVCSKSVCSCLDPEGDTAEP